MEIAVGKQRRGNVSGAWMARKTHDPIFRSPSELQSRGKMSSGMDHYRLALRWSWAAACTRPSLRLIDKNSFLFCPRSNPHHPGLIEYQFCPPLRLIDINYFPLFHRSKGDWLLSKTTLVLPKIILITIRELILFVLPKMRFVTICET